MSDNENIEKNNDDAIKSLYNDSIDISLPEDMLMPSAEESSESSKVYKNEIEDDVDVSFKFAFIGAGQAGSRIVETFKKLGYNNLLYPIRTF